MSPEAVRPFRVFLSSPGDVADARGQVRELLLGLARAPFVRGRLHIDVVSWDDRYGGATMDARFAPQHSVNRSLPTPAECDITIVLLWSRMGTPIAEKKEDGTPYQSGTEWEFENAVRADKPTFVYRCSQKVLLDPDDPGFEEQRIQKQRVNDFFARFSAPDGTLERSLSTYTSIDDLLTRVRQDVERVLAGMLDSAGNSAGAAAAASSAGGRGEPGTSAAPVVPVAYREWIRKQHGGVDLLGLQLKKGRPPTLGTIYVPQTTPAAVEPDRTQRRSRPGLDVEMEGRERGAERHALVLDRLARESLYVSGAPGTGKSTFCRWVAWLVAEGAPPVPDVTGPAEFVETLDRDFARRLPLLLKLREFWEYLPARIGGGLSTSDVEAALSQWIAAKRPDGLDGSLALAHLAHGSTLLILDGVDEVPVTTKTSAGRWHPRQSLLAALAEACPAWIGAGNRLLLTSRPYGLSTEQAAATTLSPAPLNPLPRPLQGLLAHRWFAVLEGDVATGRETMTDLFSNIDSQPWLVELAANPLLLTAMCIVYDEGKRLPQDKHELYERVTATVLFSRYPDPADVDKARRELGVIAYGMHTGSPFGERVTPRQEATFHEVERWLQDYQNQKDYTERAEAGALEARDALLSQSGLLLSTGEDRVGFAHLSFQEFFAAQRAFTVDESRLVDVFAGRALTSEWHNTLSFLSGRLVGSFPEPTKAIDLLETLLGGADRGGGALLLVLAELGLILTGKGVALRAESRRKLQRLLFDGMLGDGEIRDRASLGSALGRLGDDRFRPGFYWLPDDEQLGFIQVKAGPFTMGSSEDERFTYEDEQPRHTVDLPEFWIARYPVTIAQFGAFVSDADFQVGNRDSLRGVPNHPVVLVSWHEALAYCEWLTRKLRSSPWAPADLRARLEDEWVITLPSEAEWEKAARGADGRIYPWGDEFDPSRVNGGETGLGSRSPVGLFPEGASPCAALDMSGNVWEWTRSLWEKDVDKPAFTYPYRPDDMERERLDAPDGARRIVRGGSFNVTVNLLRAALRDWDAPDDRDDYIGFRVVSSRLRS